MNDILDLVAEAKVCTQRQVVGVPRQAVAVTVAIKEQMGELLVQLRAAIDSLTRARRQRERGFAGLKKHKGKEGSGAAERAGDGFHSTRAGSSASDEKQDYHQSAQASPEATAPKSVSEVAALTEQLKALKEQMELLAALNAAPKPEPTPAPAAHPTQFQAGAPLGVIAEEPRNVPTRGGLQRGIPEASPMVMPTAQESKGPNLSALQQLAGSMQKLQMGHPDAQANVPRAPPVADIPAAPPVATSIPVAPPVAASIPAAPPVAANIPAAPPVAPPPLRAPTVGQPLKKKASKPKPEASTADVLGELTSAMASLQNRKRGDPEKKRAIKSASGKEMKIYARNIPGQENMSFSEVVKLSARIRLKKTKQPRSPGGTPLKRRNPSNGNLLVSALFKKFRSLRRESSASPDHSATRRKSMRHHRRESSRADVKAVEWEDVGVENHPPRVVE